MILDASGKPVASVRKVYLEITILDQRPGQSGFEKATLGFELDSNDPAMLAQLLQSINRSVVGRLDEIGFLEPKEQPVGYDKRRMDGTMNRDINHSVEPNDESYPGEDLGRISVPHKVVAHPEPGGDDPEAGKGNE